MDLEAPYYNYIISFTVPDIDNVTVLDYDAREQRVYWSDVRTQAIKRAFINGTGVETVVSAGSALALDPRSGRGCPPIRPSFPSLVLGPNIPFPNLPPSQCSNPGFPIPSHPPPKPGQSPTSSSLPTYAPTNTHPPSPHCAPQTCQMPTGWLWTGCPETCSGQATTLTRSRSTWPGWTAPSRTRWCRAWSSPTAWWSTHCVGQSRDPGLGVVGCGAGTERSDFIFPHLPRKLYWTDGDNISMANMDGSNRTLLFSGQKGPVGTSLPFPNCSLP